MDLLECVTASGETVRIDEFGIVPELSVGDLTVWVSECDSVNVLRVRRRLDLGRVEFWPGRGWQALAGAARVSLGSAESLSAAVALFHGHRPQVWTPARGCEPA